MPCPAVWTVGAKFVDWCHGSRSLALGAIEPYNAVGGPVRTLETQSLSDVSEELRRLTENVGAMQNLLKIFYAPVLVGILIAVIAFGLASLLSN